MQHSVLEEWGRWLSENWMFVAPLVAMMLGPMIASGISISYDYLKYKRWLP